MLWLCRRFTWKSRLLYGLFFCDLSILQVKVISRLNSDEANLGAKWPLKVNIIIIFIHRPTARDMMAVWSVSAALMSLLILLVLLMTDFLFMVPLRSGSKLQFSKNRTSILIVQLIKPDKSGFQHPKIEFITIPEIAQIVNWPFYLKVIWTLVVVKGLEMVTRRPVTTTG